MRFVLVSEELVNRYLDAGEAGAVVLGSARNAFVAACASVMDALAQPSIVLAPDGAAGERAFPWVSFPGRDDWHEPARSVPLVGVMPLPRDWRDSVSPDVLSVQAMAEDTGPMPVRSPGAFNATRRGLYFALRNILDRLDESGRRSSATVGTQPSGDPLFMPSTVLAVDGYAAEAIVNDASRLIEDANVIRDARVIFTAARAFGARLETFQRSGSLPALTSSTTDRAAGQLVIDQAAQAQSTASRSERLAIGAFLSLPVVAALVGKLFSRR
jgi:hypothetical protein